MSRIIPIVVFVGLVLVASVASAQVSDPPPYASEIRDQCISEMVKDPKILSSCYKQYTIKHHEDDVRIATKNHMFVVAAYAALWAIVAIFVLVMWLRQRKLALEIARLQAELKKAATE